MTLYACRLGSEKNFHITKYLYNIIKFSIKKSAHSAYVEK